MMFRIVGIACLVAVVLAQNDIPGVCEYPTTTPEPLAPIGQTSRGPIVGNLMVAGGSLRQGSPIFDRMLEIAGGAGARMAYIPTNDGGNYTTPEQQAASLAGFEQLSGWTNVRWIHTYDFAVADTTEFAAQFNDITGVFMAGGRQWRCADAYGTHLNPSLTLIALYNVLARGGIVGGSSAGAAIQGDILLRGDTGTNSVLMGDHLEGFGFVHNIGFEPHLLARTRNDDILEMSRLYPWVLGVGIDENTAIFMRGDEFDIVGEHFVQITDTTLWEEDKRYCSFGLGRGPGRPRLSNGGYYFFLHPGDVYNVRIREIIRTKFDENANIEE